MTPLAAAPNVSCHGRTCVYTAAMSAPAVLEEEEEVLAPAAGTTRGVLRNVGLSCSPFLPPLRLRVPSPPPNRAFPQLFPLPSRNIPLRGHISCHTNSDPWARRSEGIPDCCKGTVCLSFSQEFSSGEKKQVISGSDGDFCLCQPVAFTGFSSPQVYLRGR